MIDAILTNGTPATSDDYDAIVVPSGNGLVGIADRAGYPVLTVPAGYGTGGAGRNPIGVTFVGTAFSEAEAARRRLRLRAGDERAARAELHEPEHVALRPGQHVLQRRAVPPGRPPDHADLHARQARPARRRSRRARRSASATAAQITGPLTVKAGGTLMLDGGKISGPLTVTAGALVEICDTTITGPLTVTGSTGLVTIGGDEATGPCDGNTITGSVTLTGNKAGVEFNGNKVTGPVTITGNTGSLPPPDLGSVHAAGNTVTGPVKIQS